MGSPTVASLWCGQVAPRVVLDHSKTLNQRKLLSGALGILRGLVELNAAGAQWAIPTGIERGISVLDRIRFPSKRAEARPLQTDGSKNSISLLKSQIYSLET